jgi:hypothetical protein
LRSTTRSHMSRTRQSMLMQRLGCGRDASYLAPPAQIRTCSFRAYGSHLGYPRQLCAAVCESASLTRLCGAESGACVAGPHSPWSPPFAPPTPQRIAPLCSSASQPQWQSATSRARASSATAPHLPDADRPSRSTLTASHEISSFRRDPFENGRIRSSPNPCGPCRWFRP